MATRSIFHLRLRSFRAFPGARRMTLLSHARKRRGFEQLETRTLLSAVNPLDEQLLPPPANAPGAATFQGLGDLATGVSYSRSFAVSADGTTVVGTGVSQKLLADVLQGIPPQPVAVNADFMEAFQWTSAGGMLGLEDPASYQLPVDHGSEAFAVSADGSVVVGWMKGLTGRDAYRWTSANGMVSLAGLMDPGEARGVSADGSVVVGFSVSGANRYEAFQWTDGGSLVMLGDLDGGAFYSQAHDVSDDGSVVVGYGTAAEGEEAFRWTADGGMISLGDLAGGRHNSKAYAVSSDGAVVVGESDSAAGFEAFRWTAAGGMVGLGDLPGGAFWSAARGVSADGSVVVGHSQSDAGYEAFLWDARRGMRSLQQVLTTDYGLDLTGWTLTRATGLSADGSTIVGFGTDPAGQVEAWMATLPAQSPSLSKVNTLTGAYEDRLYTITYENLAAAADESDPNGDPLSFRIEAVTTGTLTKDGATVVPGTTLLGAGQRFQWMPAPNASGLLTAFTIRAWDGGLASTTAVPVKVQVAPLADPPTLTTINNLSGALEDTDFTITYDTLAAAADEADPDGTLPSFRIEAVLSGTLTRAGMPVLPGKTLLRPGEDIVWHPTAGAIGLLDGFSVKAWDGLTASTPAVPVRVRVGQINHPPTLTAISILTGAEPKKDFTISFDTLAAAADEADQDGDALAFRVESLSSGTLTKGGQPVVPGTTLLAAGESLVWRSASSLAGTFDAFTVKAWDGELASATAVLVQVQAVADPVFYRAMMDGNPGWTYQGQWAWGVPTGGSGDHGGPDPTAGHTGSSVVGYNLAGGYANGLGGPQYATTPAIDCTGQTRVTLDFWRWLGVESSDFDHATVEVSNDGTSWSVWEIPHDSLTDDRAWVHVQYDISSVADNQPAVRVRWGMGPTDASVTYAGWNLDDVTLRTNRPPQLTTVNVLAGATESTDFAISFETLASAVDESDPDGDAMKRFVVDAVAAGTLTKNGLPIQPGQTAIEPGETLVWHAPAGSQTVSAFTVRASDGLAVSAAAVPVRVQVAAATSAPTLTAINKLVGATQGQAFTIGYAGLAAAADWRDPNGDPLRFRVASVVSGTLKKGGADVAPGTLLGPGESLVWQPAAGASGTLETFTVEAWDGTSASTTAVPVKVEVAAASSGRVAFRVNYRDDAGEGFKDPNLGAARRAAFQYALGVWSDVLAAAYPGETITIDASMDPMADSSVGAVVDTYPGGFRELAGPAGTTRYPLALANHLDGADSDPGSVQIILAVNSQINWYYGTDGNGGPMAADLVTAVASELGHGLGFASLIGADGAWVWGTAPAAYDRFVQDAGGTSLAAMDDATRAAAIRGPSLSWNGFEGTASNGGAHPRLFAPGAFRFGASVAHLDSATHGNELMAANRQLAAVDHQPSAMELGMLFDIGWHVTGIAGWAPPAPAMEGDINADGAVDIFDVAVLQRNYGQAAGMSRLQGDLDRDGDVDIFDAAILQRQFMQTRDDSSPGAAPAIWAAAVDRVLETS